jgi:tellurite resistance-related uncharacterized protein
MNKKTIIIVVILLIILIGGLTYYFLKIKNNTSADNTNNTNVVDNQGFLNNTEFSIYVPDGWERIEASTGSKVTILNSMEVVSNPIAQKNNFRTYYSVIYDGLKGAKQEDYLKNLKDYLSTSIPGAKITKESTETGSYQDFNVIESDFSENELNLKFMVAVYFKGNDVWLLTFNTLTENWVNYQELFYQIAKTFKVN